MQLFYSDEIDLLYKNLSESDSKPAVLSLIPEYSSTFISHTSLEFPKPLLLLYDPNFLKLSYHELLDQCESVDISITERMVLTVEKESRKQFKSKTWFKYRSGSITASRMQSVCSTNASHPSQTLINKSATLNLTDFIVNKLHGVVTMKSLPEGVMRRK